VVDDLHLITGVAHVDARHVMVVKRSICHLESECSAFAEVLKDNFFLCLTIAYFDGLAFDEREGVLVGVELRLRVRPRITIARNQVASVENLSVVELKPCFKDDTFKANSNANPAFQLPNFNPNHYVRPKLLKRFHQSESFAPAAGVCLCGNESLDLDLLGLQVAPDVVRFESKFLERTEQFGYLLEIVFKFEILDGFFQGMNFRIRST
jgi:hypothetical protein